MNQQNDAGRITPHVTPDIYAECAYTLEHNAQRQLKPFVSRLRLAWFTAGIATIVLGYAMFLVLAFVLGWPPLAAGALAIVIQVSTIFCFHTWFDWSHKGERPSYWPVILLTLIVLSAVMAGFAFIRAWNYLEDMPVALRFILSFFLSLVDPVLSLVLGAMTAAASHATVRPRNILERANEHRVAIVSTQSTHKWNENIETSQRELKTYAEHASYEHKKLHAQTPVNNEAQAKKRTAKLRELDKRCLEHIDHLKKWVATLRQHNPGQNPPELEAVPPPVIHVLPDVSKTNQMKQG